MNKPLIILILALAAASAQFYQPYLIYLRGNGNDHYKGKYRLNNYNDGHQLKNYYGYYDDGYHERQKARYQLRPKGYTYRDHKYQAQELDAEIISAYQPHAENYPVYQPPVQTYQPAPTYGWSYG